MSIVFASASKGATQEDIEEVLTKRGLEVAPPERAAETEEPEPQRDAFETDEEFEAAQTAWQEKRDQAEEKAAEKEEDEEEKRAQSAARPNSRTQRKLQRRIERATDDLRRKLEEANSRIAALENGGEDGKAREPKDENPRPVRKDFTTDEEYEDALLSWGTDKKLAERAAKEATEAQQAILQENLESYQSQVAEFKEDHDDWDETVNQDIPMHQQVQLAIMEEKEVAAQAIYYLGKHPDYAMKLAKMTPFFAVMEVGRLCGRLKAGASGTSEANGGNPPKPRPRVPAPVPRVSTSATTSTLTTSTAKNLSDFRKAKAARRG